MAGLARCPVQIRFRFGSQLVHIWFTFGSGLAWPNLGSDSVQHWFSFFFLKEDRNKQNKQGLPGSLPWGVMLTYLNDYLSHDKGFTVQAATLMLLLFGLGGGAGVVGGGALGQVLYNRWRPEGE